MRSLSQRRTTSWILEAEGFIDDQECSRIRLELEERYAASECPEWQDKVLSGIYADKTDLVQLVLAIDESLKRGRMKGLRNRQSVWENCEWILDQIDTLKEQGEIRADGKLARPGRYPRVDN